MKDNLLKEYNAFEIIMFVHELHSMGYEQLRLYAGMSPNGLCWRWYIYPKILMKLDNSFEHNSDMIPFCCLQGSTSDDEPIKKSLLQTNEIIKQNMSFFDLAKHSDSKYVLWFQNIIERAKKGCFPIAFSEYFSAKQWTFTSTKEDLLYPPFVPVLVEDFSDEQLIQNSSIILSDDFSSSEIADVLNFNGVKPSTHDIAEVIRKAITENKGLISHIELAQEKILQYKPADIVSEKAFENGIQINLITGEEIILYDEINLYVWERTR